MKTITVTIAGTVTMMEYCNVEMDFHEECYMCNTFKTIDSITVDGSDENLTKQKGKAIIVHDYFHNLFREDGDMPLPVELHIKELEGDFYYEIELQDDEEFDIKKLQLVKSTYELEVLPYTFIAEYIMYDGKKVEVGDSYYDAGINGRYCDKHIIEEFTEA